MKFGISMSLYNTAFGPIVFRDGSLEDKLRAVRQYGYDGVDLFSDVEERADAEWVKKQFDEAGLAVAMLVAIRLSEKGVNLSSADPDHRRSSIEAFKKQVEIAQIMGAHRIPVGFLRGKRPDELSEKEYEVLLADSLAQIAPFAAARAVTLCLEPVNRYEINTMNSAVQSLRFLKEYSLDQVMLLPDAFHMNIEDAGIPATLIQCRGRIGHVHLPDNNRFACGSGCFDFGAIFAALREVGYDDYVTVEAFPGPDPHQCARQSIKVLRETLL
jgi:sugar phosphate isomerase/epimerase